MRLRRVTSSSMWFAVSSKSDSLSWFSRTTSFAFKSQSPSCPFSDISLRQSFSKLTRQWTNRSMWSKSSRRIRLSCNKCRHHFSSKLISTFPRLSGERRTSARNVRILTTSRESFLPSTSRSTSSRCLKKTSCPEILLKKTSRDFSLSRIKDDKANTSRPTNLSFLPDLKKVQIK